MAGWQRLAFPSPVSFQFPFSRLNSDCRGNDLLKCIIVANTLCRADPLLSCKTGEKDGTGEKKAIKPTKRELVQNDYYLNFTFRFKEIGKVLAERGGLEVYAKSLKSNEYLGRLTVRYPR